MDYSFKGAVTCAVCPESAWLVTFLIGNVSTGVVTWSALRCGASGESGKKVAAAPLSKTAAAAAAAKTWFAKLPLDYMLHNRFPWKRSGRRSSMWPSYNNCNPGGPVGLPQGCKPIHWNPNTFLEKKVCWQIAQKLQKTSVANFTYLFWTLYFASRTKNKLKQLYFNGAVSMFFQQSLHLPKNKQPKWRLLWSHDPWDLISWFPLPSLGPSPMENSMLKG